MEILYYFLTATLSGCLGFLIAGLLSCSGRSDLESEIIMANNRIMGLEDGMAKYEETIDDLTTEKINLMRENERLKVRVEKQSGIIRDILDKTRSENG